MLVVGEADVTRTNSVPYNTMWRNKNRAGRREGLESAEATLVHNVASLVAKIGGTRRYLILHLRASRAFLFHSLPRWHAAILDKIQQMTRRLSPETASDVGLFIRGHCLRKHKTQLSGQKGTLSGLKGALTLQM
ncbi:unnamed protein product [Sphagnum jensenii]|uniref:O-fucosyltransferase family protein n=2 Tax=Sphagnum jensenii TaxID=128206 RepID=A0ABP0VHV3_9BRYO